RSRGGSATGGDDGCPLSERFLGFGCGVSSGAGGSGCVWGCSGGVAGSGCGFLGPLAEAEAIGMGRAATTGSGNGPARLVAGAPPRVGWMVGSVMYWVLSRLSCGATVGSV